MKIRLLCAGLLRVNVRLPSPVVPRIDKLAGESVALWPTVTKEVAEFNPVADAVMVVVPCTRPLRFGCRVGRVSPAAIVTPPKETVAFDGSLLVSVTNKPAGPGAGRARLIANGTLSPGPKVTVAGIIMSIARVTVTFAVASVKPAAVARITLLPAATPVTGIVTVVAVAGIVNTAAGMVAAAGLLELTFTAKPPVGAGPDNVKVRFFVSVLLTERVSGENVMVAVTCTACVAEV